MRNTPCDPKALAAYLDGTLDDHGCVWVERHAERCEACAQAIESSLQPFSAALRQTLPLEPLPWGLEQRLASPPTSKPRGVSRLRWALAPVAVVALIALLWRLADSQVFRVERADSSLVVNGKVVLEGAALPDDATISAIGPSAIKLQGLTLHTRSAWTQLHVFREGSRWVVTPLAGVVAFDDQDDAPTYVARLGGREFVPDGTGFDLSAAGAMNSPVLRVFDSSVRVTRDGREATVRAGFQMGDPNHTIVGDDPMALFGKEPKLVSSLRDALGPTKTAPKSPPLPPEAVSALTVAQIRAYASPNDPRPLIETALVLTDQMEPQPAACAIRKALELDPTLSKATTDTVWRLMRGQSYVDSQAAFQGDRVLAAKLLRVLSTRGAGPIAYLSAWAGFLAASVDRDSGAVLESAARGLRTFGRREDRIPLAWAFQAAGQRMGEQATGLGESARICEDLLADRTATLNQRQAARVHAIFAEALFFQMAERARSLVELRRAVELWPRGDWRANLAGRTAEVATAGPAEYRMMAEGLLAEPSPYTYERALAFLQITAASEEDWREIRELAEWLGETYKVVPYACELAASRVLMFDEADAARLYEKAFQLRADGRSQADLMVRCIYASLRWKLDGHAAAASDAEAIEFAARYDIPAPDHAVSGSDTFYSRIGKHALAAASLRRQLDLPDLDYRAIRYALAAELAKAGQYGEALDRSMDLLETDRPDRDPMAYTDNATLATELLARVDLPRARALATKLLTDGLPRMESGWHRTTLLRLRFESRLRWVLGQKREAIEVQRRYLDRWSDLANRKAELERLAQWEAELGK